MLKGKVYPTKLANQTFWAKGNSFLPVCMFCMLEFTPATSVCRQLEF